jgi:hypothetical protein
LTNAQTLGWQQIGPHLPPEEHHVHERAAPAADYQVNIKYSNSFLFVWYDLTFLAFLNRATIECADGQRNLVASLNGLAGVALVNGDKVQAIRNYRQVLGMEFRPIDEEGRKQLPASVNEGATPVQTSCLSRIR